MNRKLLIPAVVVCCVAWLGTAFAQAPSIEPPPSRSAQTGAVLALLQAPHPKVEARHLQRIGPDVNTILVEFATSTTAEPPVRLRAMAWLQHFPTPQTRAVLLDILRARDARVTEKRICLRALSAAFGVEVLPVVREHLESRNPLVREAAALALGDIDDLRVREILMDHVDREKDATVRDAVMASLQRIEDREAARARPSPAAPTNRGR
ncbi:MAG: HEAT repeat domain-containing protein [Myxococcota bacterium]